MNYKFIYDAILFFGNSFLVGPFVNAQTSLKELNRNYGDYHVGFKHYSTSDSMRTYSRMYDFDDRKIYRPISISIWYPSTAVGPNNKLLRVLDYMEIFKTEEEWEHLPNAQILNWFKYRDSPQHREHLGERTKAYRNLGFADGKFPTIVYAPSHLAPSIENFALCEFLASHGYVVLSSK